MIIKKMGLKTDPHIKIADKEMLKKEILLWDRVGMHVRGQEKKDAKMIIHAGFERKHDFDHIYEGIDNDV